MMKVQLFAIAICLFVGRITARVINKSTEEDSLLEQEAVRDFAEDFEKDSRTLEDFAESRYNDDESEREPPGGSQPSDNEDSSDQELVSSLVQSNFTDESDIPEEFRSVPMPTNFASYDVIERDGYVTLEELINVTGAKENVDRAFNDSDKDGDGRLTKIEFDHAPWMLQGDPDKQISEEAILDDIAKDQHEIEEVNEEEVKEQLQEDIEELREEWQALADAGDKESIEK